MIYKLGCNPNEFILATFNRNAAEEMNQRICKFIGFNEVNCGTFHSLGLRLLRKYDYMFQDEEYHIDETQLNFNKKLSTFIENIIDEKKQMEDKIIELENKVNTLITHCNTHAMPSHPLKFD